MKPITCRKCDKGLVKVHGQVCYACRLEEIEKNSPDEDATDEEIVSYYTKQRALLGCRECEDKNFGYEAGMKIENGLKYYIMFVQCVKPECNAQYMDLLEIREMRLRDVGIEESE